MKQIKLSEEHKTKLLVMCKVLFPEYEIFRFHSIQNNTIVGFLSNGSDEYDLIIHWLEFCMTHLAEKIIATYVINKDGEKIYKRTLNDDLSKFYLESLNFSRGFNKNHPIDYLYSEFLKIKLT